MENTRSFPYIPGRFANPPISPDDLNRPDERQQQSRDKLLLIPTALYDVEDNLNIIRMIHVPLLIGGLESQTVALHIINFSVENVFRQIRNCMITLSNNCKDKETIQRKMDADLWMLTIFTKYKLSQAYNHIGPDHCIGKYNGISENAKKILKRMARLCQSKQKAASNGRYIYQFGIDLLKECVNDITL